MTRKIDIFDTTLRDGEQSPGASMNTQEKLVVARQLVRLGVDVIEAGFPVSSQGDFRSVQEIGALAGDKCVVCAFARAVDKDIEVAADALQMRLQIVGSAIPTQFLQMLPYVITVIVLTIMVKHSRVPKTWGAAYNPKDV